MGQVACIKIVQLHKIVITRTIQTAQHLANELEVCHRLPCSHLYLHYSPVYPQRLLDLGCNLQKQPRIKNQKGVSVAITILNSKIGYKICCALTARYIMRFHCYVHHAQNQQKIKCRATCPIIYLNSTRKDNQSINPITLEARS